MKAALAIALVSVAAYATYLHRELKLIEAAHQEEVAAVAAKTVDARRALGEAMRENAEMALVLAQTGERLAAADALEREETRTAEFARLETIYREQIAVVEGKERALETNLEAAQAARIRTEKESPTFSEHGFRSSLNGSSTRRSGVRVSDVDRARAKQLHSERLAETDAQITAIRRAQNEVAAERLAIDNAYQEARSLVR